MDTENFEKLPEEKRHVILCAAIACFGKDGYSKTAISEIAKAAGISKAAIFHYFGTKKELYRFLCDYVFDITKNEYYAKIESHDGDLIARLGEAARLKGGVYAKISGFFDFTKRLADEIPEVLGSEATDKLNEITSIGYKCLMEGLDYSLFRDDLPAENVRNLIMWSMDGFGNSLLQRPGWKGDSEVNESYDELEGYLRILRKCYYKK